MGVSICLSLEREPSFFIAANVEGSFQQTIIVKEKKFDKICALGNRSIRKVFLNGEVQPLGYLSTLRLNEKYRGRFVLQKSYRFLRELHKDNRTKFYLTSIFEENYRARKFLTSGAKGLPRYEEYTRFLTFSIVLRRPKRRLKLPVNLKIIQASSNEINEIVHVLQKYGKNQQFYPYWDSSNLFDPKQTPNLHPEDFLLAIEKDNIIGCLAIWNQCSFKQILIRNYSNFYKYTRWLINTAAFLTGKPSLPPINTSISYCYISHIAIANNDPNIFSCLLNSAYILARKKKIEHIMVGLPEGHPFIPVIKNSYRYWTIPSIIYLVSWAEDGINPFEMIDQRIPGIEVATL